MSVKARQVNETETRLKICSNTAWTPNLFICSNSKNTVLPFRFLGTALCSWKLKCVCAHMCTHVYTCMSTLDDVLLNSKMNI